MGVGEVSASKVCGGAHGSLTPPHTHHTFKNVPTPMLSRGTVSYAISIQDGPGQSHVAVVDISGYTDDTCRLILQGRLGDSAKVPRPCIMYFQHVVSE